MCNVKKERKHGYNEMPSDAEHLAASPLVCFWKAFLPEVALDETRAGHLIVCKNECKSDGFTTLVMPSNKYPTSVFQHPPTKKTCMKSNPVTSTHPGFKYVWKFASHKAPCGLNVNPTDCSNVLNSPTPNTGCCVDNMRAFSSTACDLLGMHWPYFVVQDGTNVLVLSWRSKPLAWATTFWQRKHGRLPLEPLLLHSCLRAASSLTIPPISANRNLEVPAAGKCSCAPCLRSYGAPKNNPATCLNTAN